MRNIILFFSFYILSTIISAVVLGTFALYLARRENEQFDTLKALLIIFSFSMLNDLLMMPVVNYVQLTIGNLELIQLLGTDKIAEMMGFSFGNLIVLLFQIGVAYWSGKRIVSRVEKW